MTRVKICGISQVSQALAVANAGADLMGIIFAPSKRQMKPEDAQRLIAEFKDLQTVVGQFPEIVGVFVNTPAIEVNQITEYCGLDRVQLHGDESLDHCAAINKPVLKVIRIDTKLSADKIFSRLDQELKAIQERGHMPMLDTMSKGQHYGGTGRSFDWKLATLLAERYQMVLSGGINSDNVMQAIQKVRPWCVDTSSGVETNGVKDPNKINGFLKAVKLADDQIRTKQKNEKS